MSTNAGKTKVFTTEELVKAVITVCIAIGGGQFISSSAQPNERVAVLETKMVSIETRLPKMDEKLDTLLMRLARLQK